MEFIVPLFIIISIVTSIIGAVKKSSSKGAPQRPYFPTLSVDAPVKPQPQQPQQVPQPQQTQQRAAGKMKAGAAPDAYDPYGSTQAYDVAAPMPYDTLEMADLPSTADVYVKSAELSKDIKAADADLTELKVDLETKDAAAASKAVPVFDHMGLFKGRDEIVKALIYSEVMRPRFRAR